MTARDRRIAELFAELGYEVVPVRTAAGTTPKLRRKAAKPKNTFYTDVIAKRVPCAYGSPSCKSHHFAPNGVGRFQHTTCRKGMAALKAAK